MQLDLRFLLLPKQPHPVYPYCKQLNPQAATPTMKVEGVLLICSLLLVIGACVAFGVYMFNFCRKLERQHRRRALPPPEGEPTTAAVLAARVPSLQIDSRA